MYNDEILLSVIIPIYNGEKFIEQTVKSVLNQPCKSVEAILVNDGSTDKTAEICVKLSKEYRNVSYYEKNNEGCATARNFGLRKAKGKYVNFLDADDLWVQGVFDSDIALILQQDIDIIGFSMYSSNEDVSRVRYYYNSPKEVFGGGLEAVLSSWMSHSSFMIKRNLIIEYNLEYPLMRRCEDAIFRHMCLYVSNHIKYIDSPLFIYRNNPNSETHQKYSVETIYGAILRAYDELIIWHELIHPEDSDCINFCKRMKNIFSIEAIEVLYQQGFSENEVISLRNKICPNLLEEYKILGASARVYARIHEYENKRRMFRTKNRIRGIMHKMGKIGTKCTILRNLYEKKKYPQLLGEKIILEEERERE